MNQKVSVIIPAHNEASVISACLSPLFENDFLDNNQIIVVCNGCTDNTAELISSLSPKIICIETNIPSKSKALNLGDAVATFYPRIYLDADVVISVAAIKAMIKTLKIEGIFATSVEPKITLSKSAYFVKSYYDIWFQLPYYKAGMIGSGVYTLSEEGRKRFGKFPDIISDDGFVRCLFNEQERKLTHDFYSQVNVPKDIINLIKIKTRSRLGRYELKNKFPELLVNEEKSYQSIIPSLILNYKLWVKTFIYLSVNFSARIRAKYQYNKYTNKIIKWERDESTR